MTTKNTANNNLYEQEIQELTALLNTDWIDLKNLLEQHGLNLEGAYLAGYFEDEEDGSENGILLTKEKKIIRFTVKDNEVVLAEKSTEEGIKEFPQLGVALTL